MRSSCGVEASKQSSAYNNWCDGSVGSDITELSTFFLLYFILTSHFISFPSISQGSRSCVQLIALGSSFFSYSYIKASILSHLTHLKSLFKAYIASSFTPSASSARTPTSLPIQSPPCYLPYPKSINNATPIHFSNDSNSNASKPISFANTSSDSTSRRCDLA